VLNKARGDLNGTEPAEETDARPGANRTNVGLKQRGSGNSLHYRRGANRTNVGLKRFMPFYSPNRALCANRTNVGLKLAQDRAQALAQDRVLIEPTWD